MREQLSLHLQQELVQVSQPRFLRVKMVKAARWRVKELKLLSFPLICFALLVFTKLSRSTRDPLRHSIHSLLQQVPHVMVQWNFGEELKGCFSRVSCLH